MHIHILNRIVFYLIYGIFDSNLFCGYVMYDMACAIFYSLCETIFYIMYNLEYYTYIIIFNVIVENLNIRSLP